MSDPNVCQGVSTLLQIPSWLENHPELQRRGIKLTHPLKPAFVFRTQYFEEPSFAVKILQPETEEAAIYERLQRDPVPQNHVVPFEIIGGERPLLVMPCLGGLDRLSYNEWSLSGFLGGFLQIVEGVRYLHAQNIAHLDICRGNIVAATEMEARFDNRVQNGRIYIIDYGSSRQLSSGPGVHPAITLPGAQTQTPLGMTTFDPYSWDVYCLGTVLELMAKFMYYRSPSPPWIVRRIIRWLYGNEKGCTGVCRCRPTAHRVYTTLSAIRSVSYVLESMGRIISRTLPASTSTERDQGHGAHPPLAPVASHRD